MGRRRKKNPSKSSRESSASALNSKLEVVSESSNDAPTLEGAVIAETEKKKEEEKWTMSGQKIVQVETVTTEDKATSEADIGGRDASQSPSKEPKHNAPNSVSPTTGPQSSLPDRKGGEDFCLLSIPQTMKIQESAVDPAENEKPPPVREIPLPLKKPSRSFSRRTKSSDSIGSPARKPTVSARARLSLAIAKVRMQIRASHHFSSTTAVKQFMKMLPSKDLSDLSKIKAYCEVYALEKVEYTDMLLGALQQPCDGQHYTKNTRMLMCIHVINKGANVMERRGNTSVMEIALATEDADVVELLCCHGAVDKAAMLKKLADLKRRIQSKKLNCEDAEDDIALEAVIKKYSGVQGFLRRSTQAMEYYIRMCMCDVSHDPSASKRLKGNLPQQNQQKSKIRVGSQGEQIRRKLGKIRFSEDMDSQLTRFLGTCEANGISRETVMFEIMRLPKTDPRKHKFMVTCVFHHVDINFQESGGVTMLDIAMEMDDLTAIGILCAKGAHLKSRFKERLRKLDEKSNRRLLVMQELDRLYSTLERTILLISESVQLDRMPYEQSRQRFSSLSGAFLKVGEGFKTFIQEDKLEDDYVLEVAVSLTESLNDIGVMFRKDDDAAETNGNATSDYMRQASMKLQDLQEGIVNDTAHEPFLSDWMAPLRDFVEVYSTRHGLNITASALTKDEVDLASFLKRFLSKRSGMHEKCTRKCSTLNIYEDMTESIAGTGAHRLPASHPIIQGMSMVHYGRLKPSLEEPYKPGNLRRAIG